MLLVLALIAAGAADARAQMSMGPFHGYLTGHVGAAAGADVEDPALSGGFSVSVQEATGWGAEFDLGAASDANIGSQRVDLVTYMLNMTYVRPVKSIRPFALVGGGLYQANGCACSHPSTTYDLGFNAGGGVFLLANDVIGMRADARYFWTAADHADLGRPDHLAHWRVTVGVTYLWSIAP